MFSNYKDQRLYKQFIKGDHSPVALTPDHGASVVCYADGVMDLYLGCYITVASIVPIGCRVYKAFMGIWQIVLTLSLSKRDIMTTLHAHTEQKGYL